MSPLQGFDVSLFSTQGGAPVGRLPWADLLLPLWGGIADKQQPTELGVHRNALAVCERDEKVPQRLSERLATHRPDL